MENSGMSFYYLNEGVFCFSSKVACQFLHQIIRYFFFDFPRVGCCKDLLPLILANKQTVADVVIHDPVLYKPVSPQE